MRAARRSSPRWTRMRFSAYNCDRTERCSGHSQRRSEAMIRERILFLAAVLLASAAVPPARAAVFIPTKLTDGADGACDADCSLREAVLAANDAAGPDFIVLG